MNTFTYGWHLHRWFFGQKYITKKNTLWFFIDKIFWFTFEEKKTCLVFFYKSKQIKLATKNWNYHQNCWTIMLLAVGQFSNYTKFHCSFIVRKSWKFRQPALSLCPPNPLVRGLLGATLISPPTSHFKGGQES